MYYSVPPGTYIAFSKVLDKLNVYRISSVVTTNGRYSNLGVVNLYPFDS